jgi:hypothetical protein
MRHKVCPVIPAGTSVEEPLKRDPHSALVQCNTARKAAAMASLTFSDNHGLAGHGRVTGATRNIVSLGSWLITRSSELPNRQVLRV